MELSPKSPEKPSPRPHPKISSEKYQQSAQAVSEVAQVKWRLKGNQDGPVYQGQQLVTKCPTCPGYVS
jgi:hypothetical protein